MKSKSSLYSFNSHGRRHLQKKCNGELERLQMNIILPLGPDNIEFLKSLRRSLSLK